VVGDSASIAGMVARCASADVLAARPLGSRFSVRGVGRSMWPLLMSGDRLVVERCSLDAVRPGEIAVLRAPDHHLIGHLVVDTRPFRTSAFLGARDRTDLILLGRVVAIRRAGVRVAVPPALAPVLLLAHRAAIVAGRARVTRALRHLALRLATTGWGRRARRAWLGDVRIDALTGEDVDRAFAFAAGLGVSAAWVPSPRLRWLGAKGARGRLCGAAALEDGWLRVLVVDVPYRRLGVGTRLLEAAVRTAREDSRLNPSP